MVFYPVLVLADIVGAKENFPVRRLNVDRHTRLCGPEEENK
jgi:hypothetical protein